MIKIALFGFAYVLALGLFMICPFIFKLVFLAINTYFPDPLPFLDEIVMVLGTLNHATKAIEVFEYLREHKLIAFLCIIAVVIIIKLLFF